MKRVIWTILLFSLLLSFCFAGGTATAEGESPYERAVLYAKDFSTRDIFSGGEYAAGKELSSALTLLGYAVTEKELAFYDGTTEQKTYKSLHVIGRKDNGKEKTVAIGCYYGGYRASDSSGTGEGAATALSVGVLFSVARALIDADCDYNIAICLWGGLEFPESFNAKRCGVDLGEIALYINFDRVGAGTYDYLYADDVPRSQESFFRDVISEQKADIVAAPVYKKTTTITVGTGAYSSTHLGLLGANRFFLDEGIPCANFLGGAWDYDCGLYRYHERSEIEGTGRDTFDEINRLNGGKAQTERRLLSVANVVIKGVTSEKLRSALDDAAKETTGADLHSTLAYYLITFIGSAVFIAVFLWLIFKQGKDRRERVWKVTITASRKDDPFEELRTQDPSRGEDDPFEGLGEGGSDSSENDRKEKDDDVFYF